jgi:hypothetical protein
MGQSAAINGLPPLPPGATLNSGPDSGLPPLPPGAVLNNAPPRPQPAQDAIAANLGANPRGEGTYSMTAPAGPAINVPYSQVHQALDQGHVFTDKANLQNYARDHAADPLDESRVDQWIDKHPILSGALGPYEGIIGGARGLVKTATGLLPAPTTRAGTELQMFAAESPRHWQQGTGEATENVGEFFSGEEFLKLLGNVGPMMTAAEKLKTVTGLAQLVEKVPMIGKLLKIGESAAKQGTIAGAQTFAKTGDVGTAATAGGLASVTGGIIQGAGEGISSAIAKRATTMENVGGVATPIAGELRNVRPTPAQTAGQQSIRTAAQDAARAHLEEVNEGRAMPENAPALPARTGPFEFNLKGPKPQETNTGDMATRAAEIPKTHTGLPPNRPDLAITSRIGTEPEYIRPGETSPEAPWAERTGRVWANRRTPGFMHSPAPGETPMESTLGGGGNITTQDPNVARAHIENLNQVIEGPGFRSMSPDQQQEILGARADAQEQMARYHAEVLQTLPGYGRPNFLPVDVPRAVAKVGSWTDTAQAVKQTAVDGYNAIMDGLAFTGESPQHLTMIRNAYQAAEAKFMEADNPAALSAAEQSIEKMHEELRAMLGRVPNAATPKEFASMNEAYKSALGLEKIGKVIDGSFHAPMSGAKRSFEYSGFNGQQLMQGMEKVINTMGRARVVRLMGQDNLDTVLQVGQLSSTIAGRAKIGAALKAVTDSFIRMHVGPVAAGGYLGKLTGLGWEAGAAAGWGASVAGKRIMNAVLTNPTIAKNLIFAIDSGANPKNYGPFIGTMIQRAMTESSREDQRQQQEQPQ